MKRRWAALICCLLMVIQMAVPFAKALDTVYFTAINTNVLPLTDEGMPFWSDGYLYVDSSIFTMAKNTPGRALGIYRSMNHAEQLLVLSANGRSLLFDLESQSVQDNQGISYYPAGIQRNGRVFVPVSLVSYFFNLTYSSTRVSQEGSYRGYLVRIRTEKSPIPSDRAFADAASSLMASRYAEYRKGKEPPEKDPAKPPITPPSPEGAEVTPAGKSLLLCIEAADGARVQSLLDTLDRWGCRAVFYCTEEFLETQGGLLRRMSAAGYGIGLLAEGGQGIEQVEAQLEQGNLALERATQGKTRLVQVREAGEALLESLRQAGYCPLEPHVDWSGRLLNGAESAESLLQRVNRQRGSVVIWLDETADAAGLRSFLATAVQAEHQFRLLTELT